MPARPEHRRLPINAIVNHKEIIILGKHVLVDQMQPTLLRRGAFPLAALNEASVSVLAPVAEDSHERVVVLGLVQVQKVAGGEVLAAFDAAVDVRLAVVHLILLKGAEEQVRPVRGQRASHHSGAAGCVSLAVEVH